MTALGHLRGPKSRSLARIALLMTTRRQEQPVANELLRLGQQRQLALFGSSAHTPRAGQRNVPRRPLQRQRRALKGRGAQQAPQHRWPSSKFTALS